MLLVVVVLLFVVVLLVVVMLLVVVILLVFVSMAPSRRPHMGSPFASPLACLDYGAHSRDRRLSSLMLRDTREWRDPMLRGALDEGGRGSEGQDESTEAVHDEGLCEVKLIVQSTEVSEDGMRRKRRENLIE